MRSREDPRAGRLRIVRGKNVATVVRETERKYHLDAGGSAALDAVQAMTGTAGVAAPRQGEQLLDAVYYDTTDLRLIRAGLALRRRTDGEDAGWHLKLPAGAETLDEVRLPLAAPAGMPATGTASGTAGNRAAAPHAGGDGGTGRARVSGPGLYPGRGAGAGHAYPDQPPGCLAARRRRPDPRRDRRRPRVGRAGRWIRRLMGRDRSRAGHRKPRPADGDRHAAAPSWRPARRHRDKTAPGARRSPSRHRGHARTAVDQAFARS